MQKKEIEKIYIKKINEDTPVIMISGHANVQMAVDSLKLGAFEFIQKPFSSERLINFINRAIENTELKKDKRVLENKLFNSYDIIALSVTRRSTQTWPLKMTLHFAIILTSFLKRNFANSAV